MGKERLSVDQTPTNEPGPGVSNRKMKRQGLRVVFNEGSYHVVSRERRPFQPQSVAVRPAQA